MTPAGEFNCHVTIQKPVEEENSFGEKNPVMWIDVLPTYAKIKTIAAAEIVRSQQVQHHRTRILTIRYNSQVTSDCRIKFGCKTFQIDGINNIDELNEELEITCHEISHG